MLDYFKRLFVTPGAQTVPESLWRAVEAPLPFLQLLGPDERERLRAMALQFLDQKVFTGAQGFEPDNHVRLSIALQACLPVLELGLECYAGWSGIILYPQGFVIPRREMDEDGVMHEYDDDALGEAWPGGPIVLTWFDDPAEYEGTNVVIHEFAHKLDMLSGHADGLPPLHADMNAGDWIAAQDEAFADLVARVEAAGDDEDAQDELAIDPYAAEHPSEFFAVTSETFFTEPAILHAAYPRVYEQYRLFYRQDPLARWRLQS